MRNRVLFSSFSAVLVGALAVVACGDDDPAGSNNPDSGAPPPSGADGGLNPPPSTTDAGDAGDAGETPLEPVSKVTQVALPNAINPYGLVFAEDGKLYASGASIDPVSTERRLTVWRFNADYTLDTTFGTGGAVIADALETAGDVASFDIHEIEPGKFLVHAIVFVAPSTNAGRVFLAPLDVTGNTATWGTAKPVAFGWGTQTGADIADWTAVNPPAYSSWGFAVDKRAGATKIVVFASGAPAKADVPANQRTDADRWIARLDWPGLTNDNDFNGGAPYTTDVDDAEGNDNGRRGIVLADGSIVSAGYTDFTAGNEHAVLLKLLPSGGVDTNFGFGSSVAGQTKINPFTGNDSEANAEAYAVAAQSTGRLVTTGYGRAFTPEASIDLDMVSFGVLTDNLDPTYGTQGYRAIQSEAEYKDAGANNQDRGRDLVKLPDDRLIVAGLYGGRGAIMVLGKNGEFERQNDVNLFSYSMSQAFFKVAVSSDGKRIAATTQSAGAGVDATSQLVALKVGQ